MKNFIILTPVYNDWENLNKLLKKINDEAERNNFEFEIFVVNDSSTINANINFRKTQQDTFIIKKSTLLLVFYGQIKS